MAMHFLFDLSRSTQVLVPASLLKAQAPQGDRGQRQAHGDAFAARRGSRRLGALDGHLVVGAAAPGNPPRVLGQHRGHVKAWQGQLGEHAAVAAEGRPQAAARVAMPRVSRDLQLL